MLFCKELQIIQLFFFLYAQDGSLGQSQLFAECIKNVDKYLVKRMYVENKNIFDFGKEIDKCKELADDERKLAVYYNKKAMYELINSNFEKAIEYSELAYKYDSENPDILNIFVMTHLEKREYKEYLLSILEKNEKEGRYFENMYLFWSLLCLENCEKNKTLQLIMKSKKFDKNADYKTLENLEKTVEREKCIKNKENVIGK